MTSSLEHIIGYTFRNQDLRRRALTHSSSDVEGSYERLEFLGDRVLGLIIAEALYQKFPEEDEGSLSKRHSALVQGRTLADIALVHHLGTYIDTAASEKAAQGVENENILSDVLESLIGAVFLDGGLTPAREMVLRLYGDNIYNLDTAPQDPKTELQEWAQAKGLPLPKYNILSKNGPDHAPIFVLEVAVEGFPAITAEGPSRRQAEKTAARIMLRHLKGAE
ncbi:MAG: ribonuclease III [Alphaproteobacteria bacterium]|nr:ribonuclease III [Alphaproteobacteria bacterium]